MFKILILACCAMFISFVSSNHSRITRRVESKNGIASKIDVKNISSSAVDVETLPRVENEHSHFYSEATVHEKLNKNASKLENNQYFNKETQKSLPILRKIHARLTRSKDAVWATITLTFMCVLLVLAVAQSKMWKDHYYTEAQGVPLPNFNEKVLFKDVMEHKIKFLKKFFKKKSKEKNVTELESLLPPSDWDT